MVFRMGLGTIAAVCGLGIALSAPAGDVTDRSRGNAVFDPIAAERGRAKLTGQSFLKREWTLEAYAGTRRFLGSNAPSLEAEPERFRELFNFRYGVHPAPFPNHDLPMGLRLAGAGKTLGLQIDCMICHGGSIGGQSYVGLGNTTLDLKALLDELKLADGKFPAPGLFTLNSTRGTVNAGQVAVVLLGHRNPDLTFRFVPMPLGANLPELDVPPWWRLAKKKTMYYDGRTDARSARSNMQFLLGEFSLRDFQEHEQDFKDVIEFFKSIKPPRYPFAIDAAKADRGRVAFEKSCSRCHGTYGPDGKYPNKIVDLETIGTDPVRSMELSDGLVKHYNSTWLGALHPVSEERIGYQAPPLDGIWATAPFLHNGSIPTLAMLLDSSARPARFRKPASTDFEHFDPQNVGWRVDVLDPAESDNESYRTLPHAEFMRIFDTRRRGLSNRGHTFGDRLSPQERSEIIEYLKTL